MLQADWSHIWTAKAAEEQFPNFVFKGPGWYYTKTDTVLVVAHNRPLETKWHSKYEEQEEFTFYVWNSTKVAQMFNDLINAPTKLDAT